jgi:hypothetical protein
MGGVCADGSQQGLSRVSLKLQPLWLGPRASPLWAWALDSRDNTLLTRYPGIPYGSWKDS